MAGNRREGEVSAAAPAGDGHRDERRGDDRPLYNSRITSTYLALIRKRYPQVDVGELLSHAGMELHQVEDEGHWFTQRQVNRFQEKLRELTGNRNIAREAGRFSASPEAIRGIGRYMLGLVNPARAYSLAGKFPTKFTRSTRMEGRRLGPTSAEVIATPYEGVREELFQCESRLGYLEAISLLFGARLPRIAHEECFFRGAPHCRYVITWSPSPAARWRRGAAALSALALAAVFAAALGGLPPAALAVVLPTTIAAALLCTVAALRRDVKELRTSVDHLERSADELVDQIDLNSQIALLANEIGQTIAKQRSLKEILDSVVDVLRRRLNLDRGIVLLATPDRSRLDVVAGFGYLPGQLAALEDAGALRLDSAEPGRVFARCFLERRPLLVNDVAAADSPFSPRTIELARRLDVRSFICCPIVFEGEALGVLAVDNVTTKRPLLQRDLDLLMGVAPQIAICIRNVRLTESLLQRAREMNAELELRVAGRTAALEMANRDIESFSYTASHDLRGPLRTIVDSSGALEQEHAAALGEAGLDHVRQVRSAAGRLALLIENLLTYSRLGRAALLRETVDLSGMAREVLAGLRGRDPGRRVETSVAAGVTVRAAPLFIRVVMDTLLGSAWTATEATPAARIDFGVETVEGVPVYYVRDNGACPSAGLAGAPSGGLATPSDGGSPPAASISLATVRRIIERHGGRIRVEGAAGGGTAVLFTLPEPGGAGTATVA
jgi:GAF domain-containing protein